MYREYDAVADGNTVYIRTEDTVTLYSYDVTSDSWSQLPDCVHPNGSLAIVNGLLITVGGGHYPAYSSELFSLTKEGSSRRWTKKFPPMLTKRCGVTSLCTVTTLIVAGGRGKGGKGLSTVEVMDTETHRWSTAADLPAPISGASVTVCGDLLYLLGGTVGSLYVKSAYTCSVSALLQSCDSSSLWKMLSKSKAGPGVWRQVADLPVVQSTCESFHGRLLAIGGKNLGKSTTAVYMYDSTTNSWEIISHMTTGRCDCFTAVLPENRLMVVGGYAGDDFRTLTDMVELATRCGD